MLVIIEGCDGAGKSTLANSLAKIIGAEVIHCSSKTPNDEKFFKAIIEASKTKNIIADRFCYGQYVYQKEKDRPLGSLDNLHRLEVRLLEAGAKVILVEAPYTEIEERLQQRGEKLINDLDAFTVVSRFTDLLCNISLLSESVIRWNTGGEWK